ncbi:unnamed protein product [Ilex paraguariensis]|uniref:Uncharacterized protein n=1 Tax=Ilex paraguariensis TaxID=185542 RepID=A0ABC8S4Z8_9AQUA
MPKDFVLPLRTVNFPQICQKIIVISGTLVENLETTGYSRRFLLVGKDIMVLNISRLHILQTFLICLLFDRGNAKSVKFSRSRSLHVCISLDSLDFSVKRRLTQDSRKPHFGCGSQLVRRIACLWNFKKCCFMTDSVVFLGYVASATGISMDVENLGVAYTMDS